LSHCRPRALRSMVRQRSM